MSASDMSPAEFAAFRRLTGLTVDAMAQHLGVNPRSVRSYESGRDAISERIATAVRKLADDNGQLGREMADSDVIVEIPRDGWYIQAAARALLIEPDTMIEWAGPMGRARVGRVRVEVLEGDLPDLVDVGVEARCLDVDEGEGGEGVASAA